MADGSTLSGDHRITDTGMRISLLGLFIAKLLIERMGGSIEAIFIDNKLQIKTPLNEKRDYEKWLEYSKDKNETSKSIA